MPYTNIHWIKLKLELLNDKRFIFDCNNNQKWLYIGLLLLAATTKNNVSDDENYIKNRLNLPETSQKIREDLDHLLKVFPKMISKNKFIKFKNFNRLHNPLGNPMDNLWNSNGTPKELLRIEKSRIEKIREEYIKIKGFCLKDFSSDDYARTGKAIKTLLIKAKGNNDLVIKSLQWANNQKWCDWTLETVIRRWPDFMKFKDTSKAIPEYHRPKEKPYTTEPSKEFKELAKQIADKKGI